MLRRYFREPSPQQIAERTATPLATVRSRLQRGLSLLRDRCDGEAGRRGDWRAGLTAAFGLGGKGSSVAATATGAGIVMGIEGRSSLVAVALAFAVRPSLSEGGPGRSLNLLLSPIGLHADVRERAAISCAIGGAASANLSRMPAVLPSRQRWAC